MYFITRNFKLSWCHPELVEGGFEEAQRLRRAQPDTLIKSNFLNFRFNFCS
jgi:hypothetical protein